MSIHTPEDTSWQEHNWAEQQKVPERIEDAAKFLATMISISLTISIKVFDVGGETKLSGWGLFALILWAVSLLLAFLTIMPFQYRFIPGSTSQYRKVHKKISSRKYWLLVMSGFLFFCGFLLMIGVVWVG